MRIPTSPHFTPLSLDGSFNCRRESLDDALRLAHIEAFGSQVYRGIPFDFGGVGQLNGILLDGEAIRVSAGGIKATFIIFAHAVEDKPIQLTPDLADYRGGKHPPGTLTGNELGALAAEYQLVYDDGAAETVPIHRRFGVQQARIGWGASAFAAVPHHNDVVQPTVSESLRLGRMPMTDYGNGETRHGSGRDHARELIWLYALPNPQPDRTLQEIRCVPHDERVLIYGITTTQLREQPLRYRTRRSLELQLPPGVAFNAIGELDDIEVDLGNVISARARLDYDREAWFGEATEAQPRVSDAKAIVDFAAHPAARLYIKGMDSALVSYDLSQEQASIQVLPQTRLVNIKVVDDAGQPLAARIHFHGENGDYLPPRGMHRRVNPNWFEDNYGEFVNGRVEYAYINGQCQLEARLGEVFVDITRGYEIKPYRCSFSVTEDSDEFVFQLDRVLDWRGRGWVTADTHVHFLSPQTALLEGAAEGVNVVNLLASQWGEMFSNVSDFDGRTTLGAREFGGDGEFLVRVGTENRMQTLGHISLLGYAGAMIHPLCSGGASESAIGDALEVSMADWARRCIEQNGLVVLPHAPDPQAERAADIVLGLVHAIEMMTFNPFEAQITPYGLLDWYRYLNLGYQIPICGGSDKMSAASLLGGIRTYAHLGERDFTYENWMASVKAGNTFVTVGPLLELAVDGVAPGSRIELPRGGGTISVNWRAASVTLAMEKVELIRGGFTVEEWDVAGSGEAAGSCDVPIDESTWLALRIRGSHTGKAGDIAAHSSAVQVRVDEKRPFHDADAMAVLRQIEGAMAFVDTLAPKPDAQRFRQIRATLEAAHNRLHQRMHQQGIYHQHTPIHSHEAHDEH